MVDSKAGVRQSFMLGHAKTAFPSKADRSEEWPVFDSVSDDEIRNHAYQLYELRGRTEGHALEDWVTAERYLKARRNRANKVIFR